MPCVSVERHGNTRKRVWLARGSSEPTAVTASTGSPLSLCRDQIGHRSNMHVGRTSQQASQYEYCFPDCSTETRPCLATAPYHAWGFRRPLAGPHFASHPVPEQEFFRLALTLTRSDLKPSTLRCAVETPLAQCQWLTTWAEKASDH